MDRQAQIEEYLKQAKEVVESKDENKYAKAYQYAEKILELDPDSIPGFLLKCRYYGAKEKGWDNAKELEAFPVLAQLTDRLSDEELEPYKTEMGEICEWHIKNCCVVFCMSMLATPSINKVGDAVKSMNGLFSILSYIEKGEPDIKDREDLRKLRDARLPVHTDKVKDDFATTLSASVGVAVAMQDLLVSTGKNTPVEQQKLKDYRLAAMMADRCALECFASTRETLEKLRKDYDKVSKATGLSGDQFDSINREFETLYQKKMKEAVRREEEEAQGKVLEALKTEDAGTGDDLLGRALRATEEEKYLEAEVLSTQVLEKDFTNSAAWIIRGIAIGYKGRSSGEIPKGCRDCWTNAWTYKEEDKKEETARLLASAIAKVSVWYVQAAAARRNDGIGKKDIKNYLSSIQSITSSFSWIGDFVAPATEMSPLVNAALDEAEKIVNSMSKVQRPTNQLAMLAYALLMTEPLVAVKTHLSAGYGSSIYDMGNLDQIYRARSLGLKTEGLFATGKPADPDMARRCSKSSKTAYASKCVQQAMKAWRDSAVAKLKERYWEEHPEEKAAIEKEIEGCSGQIRQLNADLGQIPEIAEKSTLDREVSQTQSYLGSLGVFKFKEKKLTEEKLAGLKQRQHSLVSAIDRKKKELNDRISAEKSKIQKLESQLKNPDVKPDGHLPQLRVVSDGRFTVTAEELVTQLNTVLEEEPYFLFISESQNKTLRYIYAYKREEIGAEKHSNSFFSLSLKCNEEDGIVEELYFSEAPYRFNEPKEGTCPDTLINLLRFLSVLLPSLSPAADRESAATDVMESISDLRGPGPICLNYDPITFVIQKGCTGFNVTWRLTLLPFRKDPILGEASLRHLRGMEDHIPAVADHITLAKRSIQNSNFPDTLTYAEKILEAEPDNPMGLAYKATALGGNDPQDELSTDMKRLFRRAVDLLKPERYSARMEELQSDLGIVCRQRVEAVCKEVRNLPVSKENVNRVFTVADEYRQFLFDFEADTGIILSGEKSLNVPMSDTFRDMVMSASFVSNPQNTADFTKNDTIANGLSSLISSCRIQGPALVHGFFETRQIFSAGSLAENKLSSSNRFGGTLCANAEKGISDDNIKAHLEKGTAGCKAALSGLGDLIPAAECEAFANWEKPFTLSDLVGTISAHLPSGYSLKVEDLPENVKNNIIPFKERRVYLKKASASEDMFISLAVASAEDGGPVDLLYVEGTPIGGKMESLPEMISQFGILAAYVLRCLCPSFPVEESIPYACGILTDKSYGKDIEKVTLKRDYGVSIVVTPTRLFITKKREEEKK